jgi:hypothetical protein
MSDRGADDGGSRGELGGGSRATAASAAAPIVSTPRAPLVIYRETAPQHFAGGRFPSSDPAAGCVPLPRHRRDAPHANIYNEAINALAARERVPVLRIWRTSAMLPSEHVAPPRDCTHWILPGVPDHWTEELCALALCPSSRPPSTTPRLCLPARCTPHTYVPALTRDGTQRERDASNLQRTDPPLAVGTCCSPLLALSRLWLTSETTGRASRGGGQLSSAPLPRSRAASTTRGQYLRRQEHAGAQLRPHEHLHAWLRATRLRARRRIWLMAAQCAAPMGRLLA